MYHKLTAEEQYRLRKLAKKKEEFYEIWNRYEIYQMLFPEDYKALQSTKNLDALESISQNNLRTKQSQEINAFFRESVKLKDV